VVDTIEGYGSSPSGRTSATITVRDSGKL
jgi:peptidylprolyl isomerase